MPRQRSSSTARRKVAHVMREFKGGKLKSGSSNGKTVRDRKQAIAIGLSEARRAGARVALPRPRRLRRKVSGVSARS